jgi:branched-subunit amino acid aminotransferase/4-amino-4-deoxychorismate lyase
MINDKKIYTPPVSVGLIPGIVRKVLLEEIKQKGYYIYEKVITFNDLVNADEVFITNSLMGVMPVVKIDNKLISLGKPGKITQDIRKHYDNLA